MLEFAEALRDAVASVPDRTLRRPRLHALLLVAGLGLVGVLLAAQAVLSPREVASGSSPAATRDAPSPPITYDLTPSLTPSAGPGEGPAWRAATPEPAGELSHATGLETPLSTPGPLADLPGTRPQPTPPVGATSSTRRRNPEAAWHRALERRAADVQRCAARETGSLDRIAVTVSIDTEARVSAHVVDGAEMPLSRCLDRALKQTKLTAPREPASFVHVFELRP